LIGITLLDLPVLAVSRCHSGALDWRVARIRDLPIFEFKTYLVIEKHRINCPSCGVKVEKLEFVDL
jgi:transposase